MKTQAQEVTPLTDDLDVVVQKDERAPFDGVLVKPAHYREYSDAIRLQDYIDENKTAKLVQAPAPSSNPWVYAYIGFAVGVVAGVVLNNYGH